MKTCTAYMIYSILVILFMTGLKSRPTLAV